MSHTFQPKLQGKVAIITGGASGIGEATAHLFAAHGTRGIVIADIQDDLGQAVAASIGSDRCTYIHCDVRDEDQVRSMVESTVQIYGQLDIMFSNAGIISPSWQKIIELDFSEYDRVFSINARHDSWRLKEKLGIQSGYKSSINLEVYPGFIGNTKFDLHQHTVRKGTAACVKHAAREMVSRNTRGSIVCTASVAASNKMKFCTDYAMSKSAIVSLVRAAGQQLGEHGIRVNAVSPAMVATPMTINHLKRSVEEVEMELEPKTALKGTVLKASQVAEAVLFLASDASDFITGHDLLVDGGYVA